MKQVSIIACNSFNHGFFHENWKPAFRGLKEFKTAGIGRNLPMGDSMPFKKTIKELQGGSVLAECGPMRLLTTAAVGGIPQPNEAARASEEAFVYLERLAGIRHELKKRPGDEPGEMSDPLAADMFRSVSAVGDEDLTSMAAVAGAIADGVAQFLLERGMTRIVVNNGGDVAVRLAGNESVRVGVRPEVERERGSHILVLGPERRSWGVATSGLGGRSLTRGVASGAVVIARNASIADAAATAVANASFIRDDRVTQRPAEEIDPGTDIPGVLVTVEVEPLDDEARTAALSAAMNKVDELLERRVILGALVAVQEKIAMTSFFRKRLVESPLD